MSGGPFSGATGAAAASHHAGADASGPRPTETRLYFVRHAHSAYEHGRELERGLSAAGEAEARAICRRLEREGIERFVSSPYRRAIDTIRPLADAAGQDIELHADLRERLVSGERDLGPEGFLEAKRRCYAEPDYRPPGGESSREAAARAVSVVRGLLREHPGRRIAIGTHGDILTLMLGTFDPGFGYDFWQSLSMPDAYCARFAGERFLGAERIGYGCGEK
ncbi:histidine phosphatase family protein [Saccharibacillus sp. O23]|uniref:histidine phosphatase family protein n=1 Tax=Saccharibacillus sp. O23 TaxID=2009338 RepID=UPI000B4E54B7|nr:histidine phosphatase family protein [Saccharibacillus sp. O23]OWR27160.1 histidine phosphatase family protein [Saccharibacillus sp. O23]